MAGPLRIGRYVLYDELASGGMAKVHLGVASGALGFSKIVAIKRILPHLLKEQEFVEMFVDETRLASRIQHPNVVSTLDAAATDHELFLVMEFVLGESLARLFRAAYKTRQPIPVDVAVAVLCDALRGLHAAHETRNDHGELLGVVHRDVSPQNVLVGVDGVARVIDFGIARARGRLQTTRDGRLKGKVAYLPPEQLAGSEADRRTDIYAASVVLWEALAGAPLYEGDNEAVVYSRVLKTVVRPPSAVAPHVPPALDAVVMRGLARDPGRRFATAEEMALALEAAVHPASPTAVGEWVRSLAGDLLRARAERMTEIERGIHVSPRPQQLLATPPQPFAVEGTPPRQHSISTTVSPLVADRAGGYGGAPHPPAPASRWRRMEATVFIVALLVSLIASGVIVVLVIKRLPPGERPRVAATGLAPPAVSMAPSAEVSPEGALSAAAIDESPPADPLGAPTASSDTPAEDPTEAPPRKQPSAQHPKLVQPKPAKSPPKRTCDPPWYVDGSGIKRFKPECM